MTESSGVTQEAAQRVAPEKSVLHSGKSVRVAERELAAVAESRTEQNRSASETPLCPGANCSLLRGGGGGEAHLLLKDASWHCLEIPV